MRCLLLRRKKKNIFFIYEVITWEKRKKSSANILLTRVRRSSLNYDSVIGKTIECQGRAWASDYQIVISETILKIFVAPRLGVRERRFLHDKDSVIGLADCIFRDDFEEFFAPQAPHLHPPFT